MPLPLLGAAVGAVMTARNGYLLAGIFVTFKEEILAAVYHVLEGDGVASYITSKVNDKLNAAGLDLVFRNVFDVPKTVEDVDRFAARRVNGKAGTNFTSLKAVDREAFLVEVSKVLAARVNTETGSHMVALWPVAKLREELGTELARQFDPGVDLSPGSIFPQDKLLMIQAKIGKKMGLLNPSPVVQAGVSATFWGPPADDAHALRRAKGRVRAEKYRKSHRQVWVPNGG